MSGAIRAAHLGDVPAIERIVAAAYSPYIDRIGRAPAPMATDHHDLVSTNAAMTENLVFYPRLGYVEVDRGVDDGYDRVYFTKDVG